MKEKRRDQYINFIYNAMQYARKESGEEFPPDTILVVKSYSELADLNRIMGLEIFIMDMPSSFDFFVAFRSENRAKRKLQKYFLEYYGLDSNI